MNKLTIVIGGLLILLGLGFFTWTGFSKYTALIPVIPGFIFVVLGLWALKCKKQEKLAMHISAVLALIGSFTLVMGLPKLIKMVCSSQGDLVQRPLAAVETSVMGLICLVYLSSCIKYFIDRQREKRKS